MLVMCLACCYVRRHCAFVIWLQLPALLALHTSFPLQIAQHCSAFQLFVLYAFQLFVLYAFQQEVLILLVTNHQLPDAIITTGHLPLTVLEVAEYMLPNVHCEPCMCVQLVPQKQVPSPKQSPLPLPVYMYVFPPMYPNRNLLA